MSLDVYVGKQLITKRSIMFLFGSQHNMLLGFSITELFRLTKRENILRYY